jgi:hypothetical protein
MPSNETMNYDEMYSNLFARILMAVSLACICILGVIGKFINLIKKRNLFFFYILGNLIVLIVAFRKQNYRFVTNCYIINLAITDLLFLLISVPLTTYLGLTNTWILDGLVSCRVHIYFAHVSHISFQSQNTRI